jgi:hypothetical protein
VCSSDLPETAYEILVVGMLEGLFTGKKLPNYINKDRVDYKRARYVVNGRDRASEIARMANTLERLLSAAARFKDT